MLWVLLSAQLGCFTPVLHGKNKVLVEWALLSGLVSSVRINSPWRLFDWRLPASATVGKCVHSLRTRLPLV